MQLPRKLCREFDQSGAAHRLYSGTGRRRHIAGKPEKTCGDQISLSDLLKRKFSLQFRGRYSIVFQGLRTVRIQKNTHPGVAKPVPEKAVWEINRVEE